MSTTTLTDLTKEAPRSPRTRIGGYAVLARAIDKARADLAGKAGEYHYDCPLDNYLFGFKGITGDIFKAQVETGADDAAIAKWLNENGTAKSDTEIKEWGDNAEAYSFADNSEKREWFEGACKEAGIDPAKSTLFDLLEADDKVTFAK
ncbi:MAG: DUF5069 domain-containing protein [Chthoniobacterales bacterium]